MADQQKFRLQVEMPEALPVIYAHGFFGGIGPTGELMAYLYEDGPHMPRSFDATVGPDGQVIRFEPVDVGVATRRVVAQLIVPTAVAEAMADWLRNNANRSKDLLARVEEPLAKQE